MNWYIKALNNYAGFDGRAGRKEYWMFILIDILFKITAMLLDYVLGTVIVIFFLYSLFVFVPGLALSVRRIQDTGRCWANILWVLLPVLGWIYLLIIVIGKGTDGDNKYGSPPV